MNAYNGDTVEMDTKIYPSTGMNCFYAQKGSTTVSKCYYDIDYGDQFNKAWAELESYDYTGGCFEPPLLVINEGTKVMWINNDSRSHIISSGIRVETTDGTSTSFDGQFQSEHLATNETFSYIFTNSGVYDYNSWIYEECIGKIIVEPSNYYDITSPLKQLKAGVAVDDLQCKENLFLIQKYDNSPACVTFETKSKLIERGWAKPE